MARQLTEAQQAYSRSGTLGMRKTEMRAKQQIASQRRFTYDGALAPVCIKCLEPRAPKSFPICESCRRTD